MKEEITRAAKDFVVRSPRWRESAERWIEELEKGRLTVYLDTEELNQRIERVDSNLTRVVRQMVLGILLVGMLLGTAIASNVPLDALSGLPFISKELFILVFLVVAGISLVFVGALLLDTWRERRGNRVGRR